MNPFFISTTQRSGGFFLMSLLNSTNRVGYVHEHLYRLHEGWESESPPSDEDILFWFDDFRKSSLGQSPESNPMGFWGSKVDIRELYLAERWLDLKQIEPKSMKWIWLRRRNKLRQAISLVKANHTEIWHLDRDDPQDKKDLARAEIEVDFQDLCLKTIHFFTADILWSNFFQLNGVEPHCLFYEDFIDESTWEATVEGIFDFIGVPYELPLDVSTHRLKQGTGEVPESYTRIVKSMLDYNLPLKYLDLEGCYELDLETF